MLSDSSDVQGAAKKSSPQKFFAVFSATVWGFVEIFLTIYILLCSTG